MSDFVIDLISSDEEVALICSDHKANSRALKEISLDNFYDVDMQLSSQSSNGRTAAHYSADLPTYKNAEKHTLIGKKVRKTVNSENANIIREAKQLQRLKEKQEKLEKREEMRLEKVKMKQSEKEKRNQEKLARGIACGKHVTDEFACVLDVTWLESLSESDNDILMNSTSSQGDEKEKHEILKSKGPFEGSIWWTRREKFLGGVAADGNGVNILTDIVIIAVNTVRFCDMLADRADYPHLYPSILSFIDAAKGHFNEKRTIFLLQGAYKELARRTVKFHRSKNENLNKESTIIGNDELLDCISWLLVSFNVEVKLTKDTKETAQYIWDVTRSLAHGPFRSTLTGLHCVSRKKCTIDNESTASDVWLRQLMMIPGVSENKARNIVRCYPSLRLLVNAFTDPDNYSKAPLLLTEVISNRNETALSKQIYALYTSQDPNAQLR